MSQCGWKAGSLHTVDAKSIRCVPWENRATRAYHIKFATMAHLENIPERQKLDPLAVVKDYAAVPRLEYR